MVARYWFGLVAVALFALPALFDLADREWSTEQGSAGPIILASGLWLLATEAKGLRPAPVRTGPGFAALLALLIAGYVLGRSIGVLWLSWSTTYATLILIGYAFVGTEVIRRLWFPLVYLAFLIPPPYAVIGPLTHSRKLWLSGASTDIMTGLGFDAAYNGTSLYIDQYELLIADACAGLNSLISLLAITLFYVYLAHRANWRYAALLAVLAPPIALFGNLVRIVILLAVTHYGGVEVAEGMLHMLAGVVMFVATLGTLLAIDAALGPVRRRLQRE